MSGGWQARDLLLPISADHPCGESLEDTQTLAAFDAYSLFGQKAKPLDAEPETGEKQVEKWVPKPSDSPIWIEIRDKALEALAKSKDLRLLAHLGTALLRTDGVPAFAETLDVAAQWLTMYWSETYPLVDEDALLRCNALNCFADPMAVVDGLRKAPLVRSRAHGTCSLRDIEIATGQLPPDKRRAPLNETQIAAAFSSMPLADLTHLRESVVNAKASLEKIDATVTAALKEIAAEKLARTGKHAADPVATLRFAPLADQLARTILVLDAKLKAHPGSSGVPATGEDGVAASVPSALEGASISGVVRSRQDAIRALDAVADFFRSTEPSSPIPLFTERAKRLVSKDFLEVLADIVPDAVAQARVAGGVKPSE